MNASANPGAAPLQAFFAVTLTSLYHVEAAGPFQAKATKVAMRESSAFPVGRELCEGQMLSIGRELQAFRPEGGNPLRPLLERRIESVNTAFWGANSSNIVALFFNREEAEECQTAEGLELYDQRWRNITRMVLAAIGEDHPSFYICSTNSSPSLGVFLNEGHTALIKGEFGDVLAPWGIPQSMPWKEIEALTVEQGEWREVPRFQCAGCNQSAWLHPYTNEIWGCKHCQRTTRAVTLFFRPRVPQAA